MSKNPNFRMLSPFLPPPPPPLRRRQLGLIPWCQVVINRFIKILKEFLKEFRFRISGVSIVGMMIFGLPSILSQPKVPLLNHNQPSQTLHQANQQRRLQETQNLLASRFQTSAPNFLPNMPFGGFNMRGEKVTPKRNLTVAQAAAITDGSIPSSEIEKEVKQITIARNRTYNIYLFTHKGKKYWHPYGNAMTYKPSRKDITTLCEKVEEQFKDYELPPGYTIELDHSVPQSFARAMGLPNDEGAVVFVPGFANAVRTNNQELIDPFTNFDWRLSEEEQEPGGQYEINSLLELSFSRLTDALHRNLLLYCKDTNHVKNLLEKNIDLSIYIDCYAEIAKGYAEAFQHDLTYHRANFANTYDVPYDSKSSLFALYNELLFHGLDDDFDKAQLYAINYFKKLGPDQNRVTPEFLIQQIVDTYLDQYAISRRLQSWILSDKYKTHAAEILDSRFNSYKTVISNLIENCKNFGLDIDTTRSQQLLENFEQDYTLLKKLKKVFISMEDLFKAIFSDKKGEISLGNFYNTNGYGTGEKINLDLNFADLSPKVVPGKKNSFALKRNKNEEVTTQVNESSYQKRIKEEIKKLGGTVPSFESYSKIDDTDDNVAFWPGGSGWPKNRGVDDGGGGGPGGGGPGGAGPGDGGPGDGGPGGGGPGGGGSKSRSDDQDEDKGPGGGNPGGGGSAGGSSAGGSSAGGGSAGGGSAGGGRGYGSIGSQSGKGGDDPKGKDSKRYGAPTRPKSAWEKDWQIGTQPELKNKE